MMHLNESLSQAQRHGLIYSPDKAKRYWANSVLYARGLLAENNWLTAIKIYSNAMEAADILLDTDPDMARATQRHACTAIELAYVYRKMEYQRSMMKMVYNMRHRMRFLMPEQCICDTLEHLEAIINAPDTAIDDWFQWLPQQDTGHQRQTMIHCNTVFPGIRKVQEGRS